MDSLKETFQSNVTPAIDRVHEWVEGFKPTPPLAHEVSMLNIVPQSHMTIWANANLLMQVTHVCSLKLIEKMKLQIFHTYVVNNLT